MQTKPIKEKPADANCPRCAMPCEATAIYRGGGKTYQNYHCYECRKPFSILLSGVSLKNLIDK